MQEIYRVKYGTKGNCKKLLVVNSCHECHGLTEDEDLYVMFNNINSNSIYYYPERNKKSGCTACGAIQSNQLILVNGNKDEMKRLLVNNI